MKKYEPYVPAHEQRPELTIKALVLGIIMAMVLGAANAYLGLKAGMTVAATFPAAVIAMAVLRRFNGDILEENLARTTGAVGEALAAGAIFTIPAFVMTGVWEDFHYWEGTILMLIGGVLGVLFVILIRKALIEDYSLPFPEAVATSELVKAGQKGATGAGLVFGSAGLAALIELFKNPNGIPIIKEKVSYILKITDKTQVPVTTPAASPALTAVGFIIGPRLAAITFSGGVFGWLFLMPLVVYMKGGLDLSQGLEHALQQANEIYKNSVKVIAVGGMLVGAFYTLYKMRHNLFAGLKRAISDFRKAKSGSSTDVRRTDKDLNLGGVLLAACVLLIPMLYVYYRYTDNIAIALLTMVVMALAGLLFAAVAGYLVALIGSSSNPISGLTLSTLVIAAGLLAALGMKGSPGVKAALAVATVICCVAGVAGDMIQDWKVGHILGGTPWKMQIGGMLGVVAAAMVLIVPIMWLHHGGGGIGSDLLPAPQAKLMATFSEGIIKGGVDWGLVLAGMMFAIALILIGAPSPMLIAVGMYLPFYSTFAIFIGGIIKWILTRQTERKIHSYPEVKEALQKPEEERTEEDRLVLENAEKFRQQIENRGTLAASGLVAGEALLGILLAAIAVANYKLFCTADDYEKIELALKKGQTPLQCIAHKPDWFGIAVLGFLVIIGLFLYLTILPLRKQVFNPRQKSEKAQE